jgi:hypothetical protein
MNGFQLEFFVLVTSNFKATKFDCMQSAQSKNCVHVFSLFYQNCLELKQLFHWIMTIFNAYMNVVGMSQTVHSIAMYVARQESNPQSPYSDCLLENESNF